MAFWQEGALRLQAGPTCLCRAFSMPSCGPSASSPRQPISRVVSATALYEAVTRAQLGTGRVWANIWSEGVRWVLRSRSLRQSAGTLPVAGRPTFCQHSSKKLAWKYLSTSTHACTEPMQMCAEVEVPSQQGHIQGWVVGIPASIGLRGVQCLNGHGTLLIVSDDGLSRGCPPQVLSTCKHTCEPSPNLRSWCASALNL